MNRLKSPFALSMAAALSASLLTGSTNAQLIAYDDAGNYRVSANWTNGSNQGFGFGPWFIATNGPNSHGSYIGSGNNPKFVIASVTNVSGVNYTNIWGIFANGAGGINQTAAYRPFANPLGTNTFKIQWGSRGAGLTGSIHGWCGLTLRNGNDTNSPGPADFESGARLEIYFQDGNVPSTVYVSDGNNSAASIAGVTFSALGRQNITNALEIEVTVAADGDHYHMVLKDCVQNVTLYTLDSILKGDSGSSLDSVALFCYETTGDQIYNRMQIAVPTLVPPTFTNVQPTNNSIYLDPAATTLSFEVDSFNSTVASNFVKVFLNGFQQTNLTYNTTGATNQLLASGPATVPPNVIATYVITAQDANGNIATNISYFNTWRQDNPFIEAEDYNYSAGAFPSSAFPDTYALYGTPLLGTNGVDYLEHDLTGTVYPNAYRSGDLPQIQPTTDAIDHAGYAGNYSDYNLGYTENGEWLNYTRSLGTMGITNYTVYARMAGFGGNGVMLIERLANPTAATTNQARAALGTCVCPHTGGSQVFTNVPLTDFFSNPVRIHFSGTNTFRATCIGDNGSYNLNYFILVPSTNAATLRPYLSAGYPFPSAAGVALDSGITITIANRDTAVNPATIQLFLDATNLTPSLTFSNNAAGTVVTCIPTNFLSPNITHTLTTIFTDNAGSPVTQTNTWPFTTVNALLTVLPPAYAQPINSGVNSGFAERIHKIADTAPTTASIAYAEANLAGVITNISTGQPYPNLANGGPNADGSYLEPNVINYDINAVNNGGVFGGDTAFPYVPAAAVNNNIALEALMYLQLTNGNYVFVVRSDDGFKLTAGPTPGNTNLVLGLFDGGRGNGTPSIFYVSVVTNGLYPMRLLYYQAGAGGNVEFYSMNNGTPILINDSGNPSSIKSFQSLASSATAVTLLNPGHAGGTSTFSFLTQAGHTHYVEYKNALADASWSPLMTIPGNGSITNVTDNTASGAQRFYRVRSQ